MKEICLIGTVHVKSPDGDLPHFRSQRAMALLGYLAVERRPLTRAHLAALFWPDVAPQNGKTKLRRELYNLAQILPDCWEADRIKVSFVPSAETTVDLDAIRQFEGDENWQAAAGLLRGEFLEGINLEDSYEFETWLLGERERWRQRAANILTRAIDELESQGAYRRALRHARRLLQLMPWREETHRQVMRLLALSNQRSGALKQFETCKQVLWDELGVEPSAETVALYERIKRRPHFSRDNIPAVTTPIIGREKELEAITAMLADPDVRLVTITGLGGNGKTRLALDIAWRHTEGQFRNGVTFVQLAALDSAEQLVQAIAHELHLPIKDTDEHPALKQLLDYLQAKQALLVLDNCEHLLDGMEIASKILAAAAQIQILATSRERLHLRAEHVFPLQGLLYGDQTDHPSALLLKGAAQRTKPDFQITESNSVYVNRLCRLVDGMPLALELAAGSLSKMEMAAVVDEIEGNMDFLVSDLRDMPPRHRSLRAVFESTWRHLRPQTRQVFAALSAFRGSFSVDAAREIATASPELLSQLVAHALLQSTSEEDRYQMHEMIRQFASEKLAGTPELDQAVTQRHFAFYNDLAQRGGAAMHGGDQLGWTTHLQEEYDDIRQAIDWAVENDMQAAAGIVIALNTFWHSSGRFQEGLRHCERILPYQKRLSPDLRPWLLGVYADMTWELGRTQESAAVRAELPQLFRQHGDEAGIAYSYLKLTAVAFVIEGDIDRSIELARKGLKHALTPGTDSYYASLLLESLGGDLMQLGRYEEAGARFAQGHQLCLERHDQKTANYLLAAMAELAYYQGEYTEVSRLAEEYLELSRRLDMPATELMALTDLGLVAFAEDDLNLAVQYFTDGLALAREANYRFHQAIIATSKGEVLMAMGSRAEALTLLREAASIYQELGNMAGLARCIERLAQWVWYDNNHRTETARWLASAATLMEHSGRARTALDQSRFARFKAELNDALGEEALEQAWAEGAQISVMETLKEILSVLPQETAAA